MVDFATAAAANRRRSRWLVATLCLLAAAAGLGIDGSLGSLGPGGIPVVTLLAVAGTAGAAWLANRAGGALVMGSLRAAPLDLEQPEHRQLANLVREMAVASGLPVPRIYVIPDAAPNALATGRDPAHASVAVTSGLLARLDRAQTQGVIAHEMSHVGNRDTRLGVLVAVLLGSIALLGDLAWRVRWTDSRRSARRGGTSGDGGAPGGLGPLLPLLLLIAALAPVASRLIAFAISRQREYLADASAVELTRNPLALASALEAIAADPRPTRAGTRGTAHLFFAAPRADWADQRSGPLADLWATHPPIRERIARLRAMAGMAAPAASAPSSPGAGPEPSRAHHGGREDT